MVIEGRRAGVGAGSLERYFGKLASESLGLPINLDLSAIPSKSFEAELERLIRIREASLVVRRPNKDWDDAHDILSDLADSSHAHRAEVQVNAARGETLARQQGILGLIREHLRRPLTNVVNARVKGTEGGTGRERTVSLERHQIQRAAIIPQAATLEQEEEAIMDAGTELLNESEEIVEERSINDN